MIPRSLHGHAFETDERQVDVRGLAEAGRETARAKGMAREGETTGQRFLADLGFSFARSPYMSRFLLSWDFCSSLTWTIVPDSFDESQPGRNKSEVSPRIRRATIGRPRDRHAARIEKRLPGKDPHANGELERSRAARDARR